MAVFTEAPVLEDAEPYTRETPDHRIVHYRLRDGTVMPLMIPQRKTRRPMVAVIPLDASGFGRLETTRRLLASLHNRKIPPDSRITDQQRQRHTKMLRTLDGYQSGFSQREIATQFFDLNVTRDEWQETSERYLVRDILRDGRRMVQGGYLSLLTHHSRLS